MKFTDRVEIRQEPEGHMSLTHIDITYSLELVTRSYGIACVIPTILNNGAHVAYVNGIGEEYETEINKFDWRVLYPDSGNNTMGITISHAAWDINVPNRLTIYFQTAGV